MTETSPPSSRTDIIDPADLTDGYHTMAELYEHRNLLMATLMKTLATKWHCWKSRKHDDGSGYEGWFVTGIQLPSGDITYHMPDALWELTPGEELDLAPKWDGHTPDDVIARLKEYLSDPTI